jgi:ech hydrogenase subunit F
MSLLGMSRITLKNLFSRPATRRYPKERREPFPIARGEIAIDIETCILCGLCARRCPDQALAVSKPERSWEIDHLRCILCGLCVRVCPVHCLTQRRVSHPPVVSRDKFKFVQAPKEKKTTDKR